MKIQLQGKLGMEKYFISKSNLYPVKEDGGACPQVVLVGDDKVVYRVYCNDIYSRDKTYREISKTNSCVLRYTRMPILSQNTVNNLLLHERKTKLFLYVKLLQAASANPLPIYNWDLFKLVDLSLTNFGPDDHIHLAATLSVPQILCLEKFSKITPEQFWHYLLYSAPRVSKNNPEVLRWQNLMMNALNAKKNKR